MYKFRNVTSKEDFEKSNEWSGRKVCKSDSLSKVNKVWNVKDRFGNEWIIIFKEQSNEWEMYNVCNFPCDIPFNIQFRLLGREVEIVKAQKANRHYKSDRLLKQFTRLVLMANCYYVFGYLK